FLGLRGRLNSAGEGGSFLPRNGGIGGQFGCDILLAEDPRAGERSDEGPAQVRIEGEAGDASQRRFVRGEQFAEELQDLGRVRGRRESPGEGELVIRAGLR